MIQIGLFSTVDDAGRAYDAEVRRRGWAHAWPLNFPQPEELPAYPQASTERCDERGLPLSLEPEPDLGATSSAAAQGASGQRLPKLSSQKPGKSGFFGVTKLDGKNKATPWRAFVTVSAKVKYGVGYFATKEQAAWAYDAEIRRRGWTHLKRLNFPDPVDGAALLPSSAAAGEPGSKFAVPPSSAAAAAPGPD
jgi:hypothetical protein